MPQISVIVPVYKVESYLRRCVDSIMGQTFTDFELILVDDGSPDNFPAICDEYAAKDNRVHGMIFCAITGTPCIVIDSKSSKVRGCYKWIRNLDYIRFADNVSQIVNEYYEIPKSIHKYDKSHLEHYYQELSDDILRIL